MGNDMNRPRSAFSYAAHAGLPMGIYLSVLSLCVLASLRLDFLPMLILPLLIGVPVILFFMMRRTAADNPSLRRLSPLWLMGIYTFIFGSLICALVSNLYIMMVEPDFVARYLEQTIINMESLSDAGEFDAQISMMREALAKNTLPGSMQFVSTMAWSTCFFGSILSLLIAAILSVRRPGYPSPQS